MKTGQVQPLEAADLEAGLEQVSGGEMEASCKALFPMMNLRK